MSEKSFAVRGFRGFRGFGDWVEFHSAKVNVLYGPNSSGKTSATLLRTEATSECVVPKSIPTAKRR